MVWTAFGELAILYNCTRTASVRGKGKSVLESYSFFPLKSMQTGSGWSPLPSSESLLPWWFRAADDALGVTEWFSDQKSDSHILWHWESPDLKPAEHLKILHQHHKNIKPWNVCVLFILSEIHRQDKD